jgi:hypothetical protein
MSFQKLKKARKTDLSKLTQEIEKLNTSTNKNGNNSGGDERLWKLTVDKAGNGHAILRFLPAPDGEDIPWVRIWDHGFQGPGGWYIENSLTTLGKKDPVSEHNSKLWNSGIESNKDVARKQKRRLSYYSNVYVVSDPSNSENEGKVFLFKFGKKIFDKINDKMNPTYDDDEPINPFDLWEGANFKLRARQVTGFRNYDASEFDSQDALFDDDEKLEKTWKQEYSLQEFLEPKNFKSYDDLNVRLTKVLELEIEDETAGSSFGFEDVEKQPTRTPAPLPTVNSDDTDNDKDDDLSYFSKLADEA